MEEERKKRWSLEGMTALVTGGTKGIGRAVVEELAQFGARVHTCARNQEELQHRLGEWRELSYQVTGSVCDVSSRPARVKLMEDVASIFDGKLNILVNNAGGGMMKPTLEYTAEEFSSIMAFNFESAYHLSQISQPFLENKELIEAVISKTPLRRLGEAEDVSSLVAFLCLPAASYITGQVIVVDGGAAINCFYPAKD